MKPLTIDIDSTICQVEGHAKHGVAFGCTHVPGYSPLLAPRAAPGGPTGFGPSATNFQPPPGGGKGHRAPGAGPMG